MQHKFPFVSLRMEMEGNDLDVNVHPAKERYDLRENRKFTMQFMILYVQP